MREWVVEDDWSHVVLAAEERVAMSRFRFNVRGSGSAQHYPRMMLALVIYCHANGVFGSRRVERATCRDNGARYITADKHPDHDTGQAEWQLFNRAYNCKRLHRLFAAMPT